MPFRWIGGLGLKQQHLNVVYALLLSLFISVSEIQTVWKQNATELSEIQTTVNVRNPNTFGFQTGVHRSVPISVQYQICLKSEQICSDFRQKFLFEIRTNSCSNVRISDKSLS